MYSATSSGSVDRLDGGLLAQDRDAHLELGRLDVGEQAPREARAQAIGDVADLVRLAVGGQHDLLVVLVQRVERVEELVLRAFLAGEELHVVDEQHVDALAVVAAELVHLAGADRLDVLVHEPLGRDVDDARAGAVRELLVADRVEQVGLAEADAAADEDRVVLRRVARRGGLRRRRPSDPR